VNYPLADKKRNPKTFCMKMMRRSVEGVREPLVNKLLGCVLFLGLIFLAIRPILDLVVMLALMPPFLVHQQVTVVAVNQSRSTGGAAMVGPAPSESVSTSVVYAYEVGGALYKSHRTQKVSWIDGNSELRRGDRVAGCYSRLIPRIASLDCNPASAFEVAFLMFSVLAFSGAPTYVAHRLLRKTSAKPSAAREK
jgi:hypothetical protein